MWIFNSKSQNPEKSVGSSFAKKCNCDRRIEDSKTAKLYREIFKLRKEMFELNKRLQDTDKNCEDNLISVISFRKKLQAEFNLLLKSDERIKLEKIMKENLASVFLLNSTLPHCFNNKIGHC